MRDPVSPPKPSSRRTWFRPVFGLRKLLFASVLLGGLIAITVQGFHDRKKRLDAMALLKAKQWDAICDDEYRPSVLAQWVAFLAGDPDARRFSMTQLAPHPVCRIDERRRIYFSSTLVEEDVALLETFPELRSIHLHRDNLSPAASEALVRERPIEKLILGRLANQLLLGGYLEQCPTLRELTLSEQTVDRGTIAALMKLSQLRVLRLEDCQVEPLPFAEFEMPSLVEFHSLNTALDQDALAVIHRQLAIQTVSVEQPIPPRQAQAD